MHQYESLYLSPTCGKKRRKMENCLETDRMFDQSQSTTQPSFLLLRSATVTSIYGKFQASKQTNKFLDVWNDGAAHWWGKTEKQTPSLGSQRGRRRKNSTCCKPFIIHLAKGEALHFEVKDLTVGNNNDFNPREKISTKRRAKIK